MIGDVYERNGYKTSKTVIQTLVDIVSKNGNLMLNIPVRGDGTIDEKERKIVEEIGAVDESKQRKHLWYKTMENIW